MNKRIGIEFLSTIRISDSTAVYTGGANYAKQMFVELATSKRLKNTKMVVYLPEGFQATGEDNALFSMPKIECRYAKSLLECDLNDLDIFFLPQVNGQTLRQIPKIKGKYKNIKIYATLHDRQRNISRYDPIDRFYNKGIKRTLLYGFVLFWMKRIYFNLFYAKWISSVDKVFTVSNCSLQKLSNKSIKYIKCFYQTVQIPGNMNPHEEDFALFVSGNRPEKNLLRTLCAFEKFKQGHPDSKLEFKISGITESRLRELLKSYGVELTYSVDSVMAIGYVSNAELSDLYDSCKYVVFTSKAEGFGLPIAEAIVHEKLVLASYQTSIPEVVGALGRYVDAYDVDSITRGFSDMENFEYRSTYQEFVKEKKKIVISQMNIEKELFINEFLMEAE